MKHRLLRDERKKSNQVNWHFENDNCKTLCSNRICNNITRNPEAVTCERCIAIMRGEAPKHKDTPWGWGK